MLEEKRLVDAEGWVPLPGEYLQTLIAAFLATPAPLIPLGAVPLPHAPCAPCCCNQESLLGAWKEAAMAGTPGTEKERRSEEAKAL